jgi:small subunit ribosomal protein S6e
MNIVIANPKTAKAYSHKTEKPVFLGKKVGETVDLSVIGLDGYQGKITGGSDKGGFPMKPTMGGTARKKIFIAKGVGFRPKRDGVRVRKAVRGNIVAEDIHQLNVVITQEGSKPLEQIFQKEAPKEEGKEAAKEEAKEAPKEEKPAKEEKAEKKEEAKEEKKEEKKEAVKEEKKEEAKEAPKEEKKEEKAEEKK